MADTTPTGQVAVENDRVHPESIKIIAQQVGIESLPDEVARALAPDVEYRLREVIQDAMKFAKHSKRRVITTEDVNASLRLRDVDPLYGFPAGAGPVAFKEVPGHAELFFTDEKELTLKDVLAARLPRPPVAVNVVPHWLAVDGVQPVIPENPNPLTSRDAKRGVVAFENGPSDVNKHNTQHKPFRTPLAPDEVPALGGAASHRAQTNGTGTGTGTEGLGNCPYVVEPTLAHELSAELQLYFDRVTSTIRGGGEGSESLVLRAALESMETDNGLHQLVPYFVQFAQTEVATSLKNVPRLNAVIAAIKALSSNKHLNLELYLHQLMPVVVTCMVAKRIGNRGGGDDSGGILTDGDDHWQLRERAAATISLVCRRFGERYPTIQPRITRTLLKALLDETKPLATHYGAICGLSELGPRVTQLLILPNLKEYLAKLEPKLAEGDGDGAKDAKAGEKEAVEKRKRRQRDARRVHDLLKRAVGTCLHAALAVPVSAQVAAGEPEKRAARLSGKGKEPTVLEADTRVCWKIGKNPNTLKVDVGGRSTEISIDNAMIGGDNCEDPHRVTAAVAAAAALLGDCVVPYAAVPAAAGAFL